MLILRLVGACALVFSSLCAIAQQAPAAFQWDPRVHRGQLPNGLAYYLVPGTAPKGGLQMQLLVKAGSLDETVHQSGVAHMVEHMVFHESADFPQGLHAQIKALGWRVGEQINAMTNYERTLYMLQLTGAAHAQWDAGLHLLSQIAGGAAIQPSSLEGERKIVLEEWRGKLGLNERMERQRRALLRAGSLYPERPTIGTEASIRSQPASTLQQFYGTWYHPNNMALVVAGDFDAVALQARIAHWFGGWPAKSLPARVSREPELGQGLRIARMQDPESGSSQVAWVLRFQSNQAQDTDGLRARLLDHLTNELLLQRVRQLKDQLPPQVESLVSAKGQIGWKSYTLAFSARVTVDGHPQGLHTVLQAQERLRREGFSAQEFETLRADLLKTNAASLRAAAQRDTQRWTNLLNEVLTQDRVVQDPVQKQAMVHTILEQLTLQDVHAQLRSWLGSPDQLLFMIAPGDSPLDLPSQEAVQALMQQLAQAPLPALASKSPPRATPVLALPDSTVAGQILQETRQDQVLHWRLGNGDQLVWLQRPNRDGLVYFSAQSAAGYRVQGQPGWLRQMALQLGQQSGPVDTGMPTRSWRLEAEQNAHALQWRAKVPATQLHELARNYWLRQQGTQIRPEAVSESTQVLLRQAARRTSSTRDQAAQAMAALRWQLGSEDASAAPADLRAMAPELLQSLWHQQTRVPVTYYLSGKAPESDVRALAERYLAILPRDSATPTSAALPVRTGRRERVLHIGLEPQASLQAHGATAMPWTAQSAMEVAVLSQALYRALRHELREKENGIYRLRFQMTLNPATRQLESELAFTADPQRMEALWARAQDVLAQPARYFDAPQLASISSKLRSNEILRLQDDASWFTRLQLSWQQFGDARYLQQLAGLSEHLTVGSVMALAARLDLRKDLASVLLYPRQASSTTCAPGGCPP